MIEDPTGLQVYVQRAYATKRELKVPLKTSIFRHPKFI